MCSAPQDLTLIIVTSPIPSHPEMEMLEATLRSYVEGAGLAGCPRLIVSDGCSATVPGQRERPKWGRVPEAWLRPYDEFRRRLDAHVEAAACTASAVAGQTVEASEGGRSGSEAAVFAHCRHLRMEQHVGFGGCTRAALALATTPYVLVIQHDRPLLRPFSAAAVLAAMRAAGGAVRYVGLPTKASLARARPEAVQVRCHIPIVEQEGLSPAVQNVADGAGISLQRLFFWYDSTHFCESDFYRDFVFAPGRVPGGGFPEDSFGQEMHAEICAAARDGSWRQVHAAYGTYLLVDGGGPMVGHQSGRRYMARAEVDRLGWHSFARLPVGAAAACTTAAGLGEQDPRDLDQAGCSD